MAWRKAQRAALLVFGLSLAVRLAWATLATVTPISDFHDYDNLAQRWLATGEFGVEGRWAHRTPGYPAFLAVVYAICGHSWKAAGLAQAFLGAATSGLLVILASRVVALRASAIAGLLHALSPTALAYVPVLASENVAVPLLTSVLLCLAAGSHSARRRHVAVGGAGLLAGLLLLVRPAGLFFLPAGLLLAVWHPPRRAVRIMPGLTFLLGAAIVVTPWLIRNHRAGLGPATLSTVGGVNLWMGNNHLARSGGYLRAVQFKETLGEREKDRAYRSAALKWARANPRRYLALCRTRACRLVGTRPDYWAAKYLPPTAASDAAATATLRAWRAGSPPTDLVRRARAVNAQRAKRLERMRRLSAPLALLALALALLRWRSFAIVVVPALCYAAGLSLTFMSERFRELWNPLIFIPLAALLSDLLFGTRELSARPGRAAKLIAASAAVCASLLASAANLDENWYKLAPYGVPAPDVSGCRFSQIAFEAPGAQYASRWKRGSKRVRLRIESSALRCEIQGSERPSYGGVSFPAGAFKVLRLELSFLEPENVRSVYIDGYDGRGYDAKKNRCFRWQWKVGDETPLPQERAAYVLAPGQPSGYLVPEGKTIAANVAEIHVFLRIARGSSAGFILHGAEMGR